MPRFAWARWAARTARQRLSPADRRRPPAHRGDRGSVTAESAVVLPLVAAFALTMVWMITLGVAQVRSVDAARDAARALARGEDSSAAVALAERTAPAGATVAVLHSGSTVTVTVSARASPPGWLLVPLPATTIGASASVEVEGEDPGA